jgi:hypothetical protein
MHSCGQFSGALVLSSAGFHFDTLAPAAAQREALVGQRVVDSVTSYEDLEAMTLLDCLGYREATHDERIAFRAFLSDVATAAYEQLWSRRLLPAVDEAAARLRTLFHQLDTAIPLGSVGSRG